MKGIIYKVTNILDGKCYIGQTTKGLNQRRSEHIQGRIKGDTRRFYTALKKYGLQNFIWEEIDYVYTKLELDEGEQDWIWFNNSINVDHGYNTIPGKYNKVLNEQINKVRLLQGLFARTF